MKKYVKIDRKVLFEICDAILDHEGYYVIDECYDSECPYIGIPWNEKFRKKVENIRNNS